MANSILRGSLAMEPEDQQPPQDIRVEGEKRIVVVGSEGCGKTCFIAAFVSGSRVDLSKPVTEAIRRTISFGGTESVPVVLLEGQPGPEFNQQRHQNYMWASVALVCFEFNDKSVKSVRTWIDEVRLYCPRADLIVVGCKMDKNDSKSVSLDVWLKFRKWIEDYKYYECSAKTWEGFLKLIGVVGKVLMDANNG